MPRNKPSASHIFFFFMGELFGTSLASAKALLCKWCCMNSSPVCQRPRYRVTGFTYRSQQSKRMTARLQRKEEMKRVP
eukprot:1159790-Pelagomonas_calceolata.AAC.3